MTGLLSKKWHNKRSGWRFFPADAIDKLYELYQPLCDLNSVLDKAAEARPDMLKSGHTLASHLGGTFTLAPNKTREQSLRSIAFNDPELLPEQLEGCAYSLFDPVRGCIEVDGIEGLSHARIKLRSVLDYKQTTIVRVSDRYSRPPRSDLRGIFISVQMSNGVIGEIQVHTRDYWVGLNRIRPLYEQYRDIRHQEYLVVSEQKKRGQLEEAGEEASRSLTREWSEADCSKVMMLSKARIQGLRDLAIETGVNSLRLADQKYEGDCSFPMRPCIDTQSGRSGYLVPVYFQRDLVKGESLPGHLRYK